MTKRDKILRYFSDPAESQAPEAYMKQETRSLNLVKMIDRLFSSTNISILELGSGTGRNLEFLRRAGYGPLMGIEQSKVYLDAMDKHYPELTGLVLHGLIEDVLPSLSRFDLIFSMAVLEHIPDGPIFDVIAQSCYHLITIEDEHRDNWNMYQRNYKDVFEPRGLKQITVSDFPPLSHNFVMRFFRRQKK